MLLRRDGTDTLDEHKLPDGSWKPERQALHAKIVAEAFVGHQPAVGQPVINLMGGGGASGKSTMQAGLNLPKDYIHSDVDIVRTKLPEWDAELARAKADGRSVSGMLGSYTHEESSYISKLIIDKASTGKYNLLVDGAGDSGIDKLTANIERYRKGGGRVVANYATVDYDQAYSRMRERGDKIGRYIPAAHLRDVHAQVARIFPEASKKGLFDEVTLWDTSSSVPLGGGRFSPPLKVASGGGRNFSS